jgi:hypothetical protein
VRLSLGINMSAPLRAIGAHADPAQGWAQQDQLTSAVKANWGAANTSLAGNVLTRTLYVNITGSLTALEMAGPSAGTWKLVDGRSLGVFGLGSDVDAQVATNQLRTAVIHEVKVLQDRSTFPVGLGVHINCIPLNEATDLGERYAYTVVPLGQSHSSQTIYQCDVDYEEGMEWRKHFPKWTAANLEKEGVLNVENNPWVFVHQDHPIISLLRHNSGLIGCQIDEQPKIDDQYYKVTRQVLAACCATLRSNVLDKVRSNDLNLFQVQIKRLNSEHWDEMNTDLEVAGGKPMLSKEEGENFLTTPYAYTARLQIKYELQN